MTQLQANSGHNSNGTFASFGCMTGESGIVPDDCNSTTGSGAFNSVRSIRSNSGNREGLPGSVYVLPANDVSGTSIGTMGVDSGKNGTAGVGSGAGAYASGIGLSVPYDIPSRSTVRLGCSTNSRASASCIMCGERTVASSAGRSLRQVGARNSGGCGNGLDGSGAGRVCGVELGDESIRCKSESSSSSC